MTAPTANAAEKLVRIHHARDEWEAGIIVGYLQTNGVEATLRSSPEMPPLNTLEELSGSPDVNGIFVLEHQVAEARQILHEFLTTATDERVLEEEAAHKLKLDRTTIGRLRGELRAERQTFEFLGWVGVAFLAAGAMLWAIWPEWLKIAPPSPAMRWLGVVLLAVAAALAGNWIARRMKD